ncbi:Interferon regulatory factor 8 [Holothuria leucospilota]|uniref:Interferon regulatory factor 8 n=1 Tax=Holothuria leucospilota TaxID=206669 RepID=A0A9Q1HE63_HOLLE|nr:Interferon regulatory factor 8 [Holothuria leucospilota]
MADEPSTLHNGRQRLRPWLINEINSGKIKGLVWINQEKTMFKIPWKHAGKQDYDPEEDSKIFKRWSENTGKYKKGVNPEEPAVWKTRLRTALNKLPDIQEVTEKTMLDIPEPYRVYRLLPKSSKGHGHPQKSPRPPSGSEPNYAFSNYDHRRPPNDFYHGATPEFSSALSNLSSQWSQLPVATPKPFPVQGPYYHPADERIRPSHYGQDPYSQRMQQPFGRDPQDLAAVLDAIAPEDDGRNMMPPQMTGLQPYFHGNNNDPNQADQYVNYQTGGYVPNQEYYPPFTASPAPTTGYYPENQFGISSQANQQQVSIQQQQQQQQQQCLVYSEASEPNDVVMNELPPADCLPAEHEFELLVFYRSEKVVSKHINTLSGCHIYFNKSTNNHLQSEVIVLPSESVVEPPLMTDKLAGLTRSILDATEGGLTLQVKNKCIYVTRFCRSALFWSSSLHPHKIEKVERYKETVVFDLVEFSNRIKNYVCRHGDSPPLPAVYFGVAQNWTVNSPLKNCLISIVVRPLRSVEQLRTMNNQAKSLPLSIHSGMLQFSGASIDRDSFEDYPAEILAAGNYPFDPLTEEVFIQSEGDSPSP